MKQFELTDELIDRNPKLDRELIQRNDEMSERLREQGVQRKGYDLVPPFGGHKVTVQDHPGADRRLVRLRRKEPPA